MTISRIKPIAQYLFSFLFLTTLFLPQSSPAQAPGGIIEPITSAQTRPVLGQAQIQSLLPTRGKFTFPAPYNTEAVRVTNATDCAGATDCVHHIGYSYWRNMNNHVGSDTMYIFLGLNRNRGGNGPTLFSYNKLTDALTTVGPLFNTDSSYSWASGEGWYFSATLPTKLYMNDGAKMLRYDVISKQFETVFDASSFFGTGKIIWQMHSSNDDRVHSATLRSNSNYEMLGCMVYHNDTNTFSYFPKTGDYDECQIDRSGRWLLIKENVDGAYGEDNRIIDLDSGSARILLDQNGAAGHSDLGFGTMIAADNWANLSNTQKVWQFNASTLQGTPVYYNFDWNSQAPGHVSYTNASASIPLTQQYACGSSANRNNSPHANEIICFLTDTSTDVLVVAPVMTNLNATGGDDDYGKSPKGNLDVTGKYFIWTSNMGDNRLDAFVVKVPGQLLTGTSSDTIEPTVAESNPGDTTAPTLSGITSPSISSTAATIIWNTNEPADSQIEYGLTTAYGSSTTLNSSLLTSHSRTLSGLTDNTTYHYRVKSRDNAGNLAVSGNYTFTTSTAVVADTTNPVVSNITTEAISATSATINWTSNEPANSQVQYGLTSSYGSSTIWTSDFVIKHSVNLTGLKANTLYYYRVRARDAAGNIGVSDRLTFRTAKVRKR